MKTTANLSPSQIAALVANVKPNRKTYTVTTRTTEVFETKIRAKSPHHAEQIAEEMRGRNTLTYLRTDEVEHDAEEASSDEPPINAPDADLLAALRNLTEWGCTHTSFRDPNSPHTLLLAARLAIAKAEGSK